MKSGNPIGSSEFFRLFFGELERLNIAYVVLHSYDTFPEGITSDVDYAVLTRDLPKLAAIQAGLAERHGWRLAQAIEAHIYALYTVVIDPEDANAFLQLDACGHYVENNCFLLRDTFLLDGRQRFRDFYVPAAAVEFAYLLVKALSKSKPIGPRLARLRELWERAPAEIEQQFLKLCGPVQGTLANWFAQPPAQWERLRPIVAERNRFGWGDRSRELLRAFKRARRPEGLHLAFLGPDGSGKSTVLDRVGPLIERPFFRRQRLFHFRPGVFESRKENVPVTNPHGQTPRSVLGSIAKLIYYFIDHLAGYIAKVMPAKIRDELVIFCRNFDDVLIDPRRYRLRGADWLARSLRPLLPRADMTFVLDAEPEVIRARKAELSLDELTRQRGVLKRLASTSSDYVLVSSAESPEQVTKVVCREVIQFLAEREKRRQWK